MVRNRARPKRCETKSAAGPLALCSDLPSHVSNVWFSDVFQSRRLYEVSSQP
jgi:hypothetical protein